VNSVSRRWWALVATFVVGVGKAMIKDVMRGKALDRAADGTPEMVLAARLRARRGVNWQRAALTLQERFLDHFHLLPTAYLDEPFWDDLDHAERKIRRLEVPPLEAIERPKREDPAA
jgi:hypothetical protein